MRPAEVDVLRGDYKKAQTQLGWTPKTSFTDLVKVMVQNDINLLKK
jgi:GDPmannose 4,6-dehydratase